MSAFKGEVGKNIRNQRKIETGRFVARCEKSKLRHFGQFFKGVILSRIKAYSVAEQRLPKHTVRQRRSGLYLCVTISALCYLLYSVLPDFADLKRFSMNTRSVTERKGEKWTTTQKE